jgi:hypothetical protein
VLKETVFLGKLILLSNGSNVILLVPGKKKRGGQRLTDLAKGCRFNTVIESKCLGIVHLNRRGEYLEPALTNFFSEREFMEYGLMKIWRGGVATNKERLLATPLRK